MKAALVSPRSLCLKGCEGALFNLLKQRIGDFIVSIYKMSNCFFDHLCLLLPRVITAKINPMQKPTSPQKHTPARSRRFLIVILILIPTLFILSIVLIRMADRLPLVSVLWSSVQNSFKPNLAQETAKPIEKGLKDAGAVKKCSRGDDGRGVSNRAPWYYAIYEVPGDRKAASALVSAVAKENGFDLTDGPFPANPKNNDYYSDQNNKYIGSPDLEEGNVELRLIVFGNSTHNSGDKFCTVSEGADSLGNMTTIRITVNLPPFKS
jgi:hypothetical protein